MRDLPKRVTLRLVIHPSMVEGRGLAAWTLIREVTRGRVPSAEVWAQGNIPLAGPDPSYEQVLEAIDGIVGPQLLA